LPEYFSCDAAFAKKKHLEWESKERREKKARKGGRWTTDQHLLSTNRSLVEILRQKVKKGWRKIKEGPFFWSKAGGKAIKLLKSWNLKEDQRVAKTFITLEILDWFDLFLTFKKVLLWHSGHMYIRHGIGGSWVPILGPHDCRDTDKNFSWGHNVS